MCPQPILCLIGTRVGEGCSTGIPFETVPVGLGFVPIVGEGFESGGKIGGRARSGCVDAPRIQGTGFAGRRVDLPSCRSGYSYGPG